ncbi:hypothetical protein KFE25_014351 [Diacronema lutheri]|uniref:EamA domain-containing protein n=3 Tax=Diacronema lutheri TaxID=2081491 RepID=A0A8J6C9U8_DIALT|nr:hypothetical protein KFE25_014351 [Diacronema lutheri]
MAAGVEMSSAGIGLAAALAAPALSALGCMLWDRHWAGSAFALNLFKCATASLLFAVTVGADGHSALARNARAVPLLCASSLLGIIVGDLAWLASMRLLGARRVILVDSLKPFLAAAFGGALGEGLTVKALGAMTLAVVGILAVALERTAGDAPSEDAPASAPARPRSAHAHGYALAITNVLFDVVGAVLTKRVAGALGPFEIGLVRFGFAALVMAAVALSMAMRRALRPRRTAIIRGLSEAADVRPADGPPSGCGGLPRADAQPPARGAEQHVETVLPLPELASEGAGGEDAGGERARAKRVDAGLLDAGEAAPIARWHELPRGMPAHAWLLVGVGVLLVTFLAVALGNVALFRLPLGLFLTLQSLGPIYALPIALCIKGEVASARAWAGSCAAVVGVALFCLETLAARH